jgi:hypothetical protein
VPKPPLTREQILDQLRRVTDEGYHAPFFDDPGGAIAQFRGLARANAVVAEVASRSATRQFFVAPPGFESAGPSVRASASITVQRTRDLDQPMIASAGSLSFAGPNGRVYRSTADVIWYPAPDPERERVVDVVCDFVGEPGNLDPFADDDGNLTDPKTGAPQLSVLDLQALSQERAGIRARLTVGPLAQLVTNGVAPTWAPSDVGLYLEITAAGTAANVGRVLRIVSWSAATEPGAEGYYARTIELDDGLQLALTSAALLDDGGVFTDYTAAAQAGVASTVPLLPAVPVVGDAFLYGGDAPFAALEVAVTTRLYGVLTLAWEWWDGAVWQPAADLVDGTDGYQVEGVSRVEHTIDPAWATLTIGTRTAYWLRARVSAFTSIAAQPLAGRLVTLTPDPLLADPLDANGDGQIGWAIRDYRDLGLEILDMPAPSGGRDDDLGLKLAERQIRRRPLESLEVLRRRAGRFPDVITPEAITWEINRILEPLGLAGEVCDLGSGFIGLFCDVPTTFAPAIVGAFDLYAPGDLFPVDETMLVLNEFESRWHFFVKVPVSGLGEFGAAWDEGPPSFYADSFGGFLGCAWDFAFCDGYPAVAAAAFKAVWERVSEAKAGGIAFTMIEGDVPVCV